MADNVIKLKIEGEGQASGGGGSGGGGGGSGGGPAAAAGGDQPLGGVSQMIQMLFGRNSTIGRAVSTMNRSGVLGGGEAAGEAAGGVAKAAGAAGGAGGIGGLAEGISGLAEAAGPAGLALFAIKETADAVTGSFKKVAEVGTQVVLGDFYGSIRMMSSGILKAIDPLGVWSEGLIKAADALNGLTQAFLQKADQLAKYSPDIAVAKARAEVAETMHSIGEAQQLGPRLARLVELQSQTQLEFEKAMLPVKEALLELAITVSGYLKEMVEFMGQFAGFFRDLVKGMNMSVVVVMEWFKTLFAPFTFVIHKLASWFGWDKETKEDYQNDAGKLMRDFLNAAIFPMSDHPNLWPFPLPKAGAPAFNGGGG